MNVKIANQPIWITRSLGSGFQTIFFDPLCGETIQVDYFSTTNPEASGCPPACAQCGLRDAKGRVDERQTKQFYCKACWSSYVPCFFFFPEVNHIFEMILLNQLPKNGGFKHGFVNIWWTLTLLPSHLSLQLFLLLGISVNPPYSQLRKAIACRSFSIRKRSFTRNVSNSQCPGCREGRFRLGSPSLKI